MKGLALRVSGTNFVSPPDPRKKVRDVSMSLRNRQAGNLSDLQQNSAR